MLIKEKQARAAAEQQAQDDELAKAKAHAAAVERGKARKASKARRAKAAVTLQTAVRVWLVRRFAREAAEADKKAAAKQPLYEVLLSSQTTLTKYLKDH